jgi:D-ala D-ala ligase C-terminus
MPIITGYQDSGADIAYTLSKLPSLQILTPYSSPSSTTTSDWVFPDTEPGILSALTLGATHLWANTILFSTHPLQTSSLLTPYQNALQIIGQPPNLIEKFDDKEFVNDLLRKTGGFTLPRGWSISKPALEAKGLTLREELEKMKLPYSVVGKPVRGRGSYGVRVCSEIEELEKHIEGLFEESPTVMIEEFLSGEEATITIMPPGNGRDEYWALPIVTRFNHAEGVAPYNGVVAVTANSRVVSEEECARDGRYGEVARECEGVAKLLGVTAPIRIDVRRFREGMGERFALFDVNMKPVS